MFLTNIGVGALLFIGYFIYDFAYAKWVEYVTARNAVYAANTSAVIYLIGAFGVIQLTTSLWFILPILLGGWLGTYCAVRFKHEKTTNLS